MNCFIQTLESRTLFSVSAGQLAGDLTTVKVDATPVHTAVVARHASEVALRQAVTSDLKLITDKTVKAENRKLLAALVRAIAVGDARVAGAAAVLVANAKSRSAVGAAQGKALLLKPTNAAFQTHVNKDVINLNAVVPAKDSLLNTAISNAAAAINLALVNLSVVNPSVSGTDGLGETNLANLNTSLAASATQLQSDTSALANDLAAINAPMVSAALTGATLFRGDSNGNNLDTTDDGTVIAHGGWTSGLDIQNVPGNYGAELFISKVANPTAAEFLTPGALAASLVAGANTFYFFGDGDDTLGGSATFGINLYLNNAANASPSLSVYAAPSTTAFAADSAPTTAAPNFAVVPGAGTLTAAGVSLTNFQVLGVSGQGSTVDLVDSTNTAPFVAPAAANGIADTYGTFTLTLS